MQFSPPLGPPTPYFGCLITFKDDINIDTFASVKTSSNINLIGASFRVIDQQQNIKSDDNSIKPFLNNVVIDNAKLFVSDRYLSVIDDIFKIPSGEVAREETGEPYIKINSTGDLPVAIGTNAIAIGTASQVSNSEAINAVQIGTGDNVTANTIQFLDNTIANEHGIETRTGTTQPTHQARDGSLYVDTSALKLYFRAAGQWVAAN